MWLCLFSNYWRKKLAKIVVRMHYIFVCVKSIFSNSDALIASTAPPWLGRRWPHLHGTHMITHQPWHWLGKATCLHQIFSTLNIRLSCSLRSRTVWRFIGNKHTFLFWNVHQTFNWRPTLQQNSLCVIPLFASGNDVVSSMDSVCKKIIKWDHFRYGCWLWSVHWWADWGIQGGFQPLWQKPGWDHFWESGHFFSAMCWWYENLFAASHLTRKIFLHWIYCFLAIRWCTWWTLWAFAPTRLI